jgi:PPOX class probable F420-dependent enzyme
MAAQLTDAALEIINKKNFAHVATLFEDGSPQVTPVWVDASDGKLRINSAEGRRKVDNLRRDGRVSVEIHDTENPYSYVEVRGNVVKMTHDGADDHIDALAKKYLGVDSYPNRREGEVRVKIEIEPEKVNVQR